MGLRIAVGGFMHETNTFVAKPTTWNDFVEAGQALVQLRSTGATASGRRPELRTARDVGGVLP